MDRLDRFIDPIHDRLREWAQLLWSYVQGLTPDQIQLCFLGLLAVGCLLSIWLLYSIHRRSHPAERDDLGQERGREVGLPTFVEPGRAGGTGHAAAEIDSGGGPEDVSDQTPAPPRPAKPAAAPAAVPLQPVPAAIEAAPSRETLISRLRNGLSATRNGLVRKLDALVGARGPLDDSVIAEIEEVLIASDVGVRTAAGLLESVRSGMRSGRIRTASDLRTALKERIFSILSLEGASPRPVTQSPQVILVVGVNGTGKTTSIGKLAARLKRDGKQVMLAAADTFRAAAIEQLEVWGQRSGIPVIRQAEGSDPGAVAFDALQAAKARGMDVLIVDTAGRMHTKKNLMDEIRKVKRVLGRDHPGAPHEVLLVLDATTGQNAISQAHLFHEALELSGIVLTKLDGTAKGGVIVGICDELGVPVRYIGIGETIDDLRPFDAREFVDALFGEA